MSSPTAKGKPPPRSKKKANKKKEEERKRLEEEEAEEENELEFQKACLEIRVKELETLNLGLKQKCSYLETQNDVFKVQLEEAIEEKDDLVSHLTRKLSAQITISKELEERLIGMQRARTDDWKAFEERIKEKDVQFREMKEKLEENIQALELKLASIDDFQVNKTNTERKMAQLETTIETERQMHEKQYDELECKMILYKEEVKNDAVETLVNLAKEVQKIGKLSLNATIKSAISTNIKLNEELEKVSESNLRLRSNLDSFTKERVQKRKSIINIERDNGILLKKCNQFKKLLELSVEKQLEMKSEIHSTEKIKLEFEKLKLIHGSCKTSEEIQQLIQREIEIVRKVKEEESRDVLEKESANLIEELRGLQIILINTSIATKDMLKAESVEESEFFKKRFKKMIIKIYETACNFPLSDDLKVRLQLPIPKITDYVKFGFT